MPNKSKMLGVFELSAGAGAAGASEAKGLVALAPSCKERKKFCCQITSVTFTPNKVHAYPVFLHSLFFLGEKLPLQLFVNV